MFFVALMHLFVEMFAYYLVVLPIYVLLDWLICREYRKNDIVCGKGFVIGWQLLAVLVCGIFSVTGTAGADDILRNGTSLIGTEAVNLIPFAGSDAIGMVLNAVLFVPLGVVLPLLWRGCNLPKTLGTGFALSLLIELSQLFNYRATDIDDLIMNTLGTLIGYSIYVLCLRKITVFQADNRGKTLFAALSSVCVMFAAYVLIASPLLLQILRIVYGY